MLLVVNYGVIWIQCKNSGCPGFEDVQDVIFWLFVDSECCIILNNHKQKKLNFLPTMFKK
jgi:hypothetical protein